MDILAERLRKIRRIRRLTQQELEKLSGVHSTTISRIESEDPSRPAADTVRDLAKALGVTMDYLMGLEDTERHEDP